MNIPAKLKELRVNKQTRRGDLCRAVGISPSCYSNYEAGIREVSLTNLVKIADFYNVTTDWILGRDVSRVTDPAVPERTVQPRTAPSVTEMYNMLNQEQQQRVYGIIWGLCALSGKDVTKYGL